MSMKYIHVHSSGIFLASAGMSVSFTCTADNQSTSSAFLSIQNPQTLSTRQDEQASQQLLNTKL